jgi:hypothetical protein
VKYLKNNENKILFIKLKFYHKTIITILPLKYVYMPQDEKSATISSVEYRFLLNKMIFFRQTGDRM